MPKTPRPAKKDPKDKTGLTRCLGRGEEHWFKSKDSSTNRLCSRCTEQVNRPGFLARCDEPVRLFGAELDLS